MSRDFDVCVIGSGAGGGPVAYELAMAGYSVLVLEKGPWLTERHYRKDELACCRRGAYTPTLGDEQHVIEPDAVEAVLERQHALDLVRLDHGCEDPAHGERLLAVRHAPPRSVATTRDPDRYHHGDP